MDVYLITVPHEPFLGPSNIEPSRAEGSLNGRLPNYCIPRTFFKVPVMATP